jgi:hypothetical protein
VYFEYVPVLPAATPGSEPQPSSSSALITVENVPKQGVPAAVLLSQLLAQHPMSPAAQYSLFVQLWFARNFTALETRQSFVRIRLKAFIVMMEQRFIHVQDYIATFMNQVRVGISCCSIAGRSTSALGPRIHR